MSSIAPAVVGVAGTLSGGTLAAAVSLWSARAAYKRQRRLDHEKARTDRAEKHRDHRQQIYAEWIIATEHIASAAGGDRADDMTEGIGQLRRIGAAILLSGTQEVRLAVESEEAAWVRVASALHDRHLAVDGARQLHESTLGIMRLDLQPEVQL